MFLPLRTDTQCHLETLLPGQRPPWWNERDSVSTVTLRDAPSHLWGRNSKRCAGKSLSGQGDSRSPEPCD